MENFADQYLNSAKSEFLRYKNLGLKAIQSLTTIELNLDLEGANSIAIIVKHLHGNMKSRWTNPFTSDGEKPDRNRDGEFTCEPLSKELILELYLNGWACLEVSLSEFSPEDFHKSLRIRNESLNLLQGINRQISHYAYHVGQIVILAKRCKGETWNSLSIPKGKSAEYGQGRYNQK